MIWFCFKDEKKNDEVESDERQAPPDGRAVTVSEAMEEGGEEETMV